MATQGAPETGWPFSTADESKETDGRPEPSACPARTTTSTIHKVSMHRKHLFAGLMAAAFAGTTFAAATIDVIESGTDVIATGGGSVNLSGVGPGAALISSALVFPSLGAMLVGPGSPQNATFFAGLTGPSSFGSGTTQAATSGSGGLLGFSASDGVLIVPNGYVSGSALSSTSTWSNQTFSSLGMTPGTYVWTWGAGATADSLTLNIGAVAPVPEPGTWTLMAGGLGVVAWGARRRRARSVGRA